MLSTKTKTSITAKTKIIIFVSLLISVAGILLAGSFVFLNRAPQDPQITRIEPAILQSNSNFSLSGAHLSSVLYPIKSAYIEFNQNGKVMQSLSVLPKDIMNNKILTQISAPSLPNIASGQEIKITLRLNVAKRWSQKIYTRQSNYYTVKYQSIPLFVSGGAPPIPPPAAVDLIKPQAIIAGPQAPVLEWNIEKNNWQIILLDGSQSNDNQTPANKLFYYWGKENKITWAENYSGDFIQGLSQVSFFAPDINQSTNFIFTLQVKDEAGNISEPNIFTVTIEPYNALADFCPGKTCAKCQNNNTLEIGVCNEEKDVCIFTAPQTEVCSFGCQADVCLADSCAGISCPNQCQNNIWRNNGTCSQGLCAYQEIVCSDDQLCRDEQGCVEDGWQDPNLQTADWEIIVPEKSPTESGWEINWSLF